MARLYEIAATIEASASTAGATTAPGAMRGSTTDARVGQRSGGAAAPRRSLGLPKAPAYDIVERTRPDYSNDDLGEQEWRRACRQAGISPAHAGGLTLEPEPPEE